MVETVSIITGNPACFQMKANFLPCAILQLNRYDLDAMDKQLKETVQKAPNFFMGSPIVMDLDKLNGYRSVDFDSLKQLLLMHGMIPVGVRGGNAERQAEAIAAGLPALAIGKSTYAEKEKKQNLSTITKLVTHPIRGGMQIYAKEGDLIVTAQVSPGAELIAEGHIHVYGALRGRALAGVQGNAAARIFCRTLEAELVSIAGYYLTKEDIQKLPAYDGMIQIYLEHEQVKIESL